MIRVKGMKVLPVKNAPAEQVLIHLPENGTDPRYAIRAMDPDKEAGLLCFDAKNPTTAEFIYATWCVDLGVKAAFLWSPEVATIGVHQSGGEHPIIVFDGKTLVKGTVAHVRSGPPNYWDVSTGDPTPWASLYGARAIAVHKCSLAVENEQGLAFSILELGEPATFI